MRLLLIVLIICLFLIVMGKKGKTTGPCTKNGKCRNPNDYCQVSDNTCYRKTNTQNPNNNNNAICADKTVAGKPSDCPTLKYLCNDRIYYQLMTEQCARTCNRGACTG